MEQSQVLFKERLTIAHRNKEMGERYEQFRREEELEVIADHRERGEKNAPSFLAQEKAS